MTLAYLTVIGNKQGQFKAEGVPVQHKASIPVLAFVMDSLPLGVPRPGR